MKIDEGNHIRTNSQSKEIDIGHFIQAFQNSARKSDVILLILVLSALFSFGALWNSLSDNSIVSRLRLAQYAYSHNVPRYLYLDATSINKLSRAIALIEIGCIPQSSDTIPVNLLLSISDSLLSDTIPKFNECLAGQDTARLFTYHFNYLERSISLMKIKGFYNNEMLKPYLDYLNQFVIENVVTVRIPILGIVMDINDLGLFCGIVFMGILALALFELKREHTIVKAFLSATIHSPSYYHLLLPNPKESTGKHSILFSLRSMAYALPLLTLLNILISDIRFFSFSVVVGAAFTYMHLTIELICLVGVVMLTIRCISTRQKIDRKLAK